jgi:hypothetical protein
VRNVQKRPSQPKEIASRFIDNMALLAAGNSFWDTHARLKALMEGPGGAFEWAREHNCEFEVDKFKLINFTRKQAPHPFLP